jgi:hypothetical protein
LSSTDTKPIIDRHQWGLQRKGGCVWYRLRRNETARMEPVFALSDAGAVYELIVSSGCRMPDKED